MSAGRPDALDRLAGVGHDLLGRVDAVLLAGGAAADDPIWPLLRRAGALPGDALEFGLRLDAEALRTAAGELRAVAGRFADRRSRLAADIDRDVWEGSGADAFADLWHSLSGHLGTGDDPATVCGRLTATASYVDGVADWVGALRHELAEAIARVATSTEAVTIRGQPAGSGGSGGAAPAADVLAAAARIGARVLQPVADALVAARELRSRWAGTLDELRYTAPDRGPGGAASPVTRVQL